MAANWTAFVAGNVLEASQLNGVVDNFADIAIFNETQASGTNGGTSVAATWTKRTLNTTVVNNIGSCTLTSSVISLPAGTYNAKVSTIMHAGSGTSPDSFRHRLRNTTAGTNLGLTTSGYGGAANNDPLPAEIVTAFTLSATSNIEVQYYMTGAITNVGLGRASTIASTDEIYTQIQITRIA